MRLMRRFSIALAALAIAGSSPARAEYPDRAIQIVVPYTPAGTVDLLARALGPRLTARQHAGRVRGFSPQGNSTLEADRKGCRRQARRGS
jgi:hypothetical protein